MENNIKKYRIWKGLKQKELAKLVKISTSELRLIEKNKIKRPRAGLRLRICDYFGVSHDQMFYSEED